MSENCNNKNPLQRDGTSQSQRLLEALLPSYVLVDERKLEDLIAFVAGYASKINYYNVTNTVDGDWVGFFTKDISEDQKTEPHYALFISFLEIFKIAQDDLNTITQRHLDFYYREVLNLHEKPAVADQVYIIFELAEQLSSALVPKAKELDAKKDATGADLIYETDKDIVVNHGKVDQLKTVFINRPIDPSAATPSFPDLIPVPDPTATVPLFKGNEWRIYSSPVANSADGIGAEIEGDEKRWRIFGKPLPVSEGSSEADRPQAEIGFAFASPLLFLAEGTRTITIRINSQRPSIPSPHVAVHHASILPSSSATLSLSNQLRSVPQPLHASFIANFISNQTNNALTGALKVYLSGEEEWILPEIDVSTYYDVNGDLVIERTITKGQKPVVAYNEEVLLQPFKTNWPVVKIILNTEHPASPYIYEQLSSKNIFTADLTVDVVDVKNIVVQSEDTVLATEKPFTPFGNQPVIGSTFYIGSTEIFQKHLSSLDVNITWHGLPNDTIPQGNPPKNFYKYPEGFFDYYANYLPFGEQQKRATAAFNVDMALLDKQSWIQLNNTNSGYKLFTSRTEPDPTNTHFVHPVDNDNIINTNTGLLGTVPRDPKMDEVSEFGATTKKGFLRMTLADVDFGHSIFQNSYAQQAIWMTKGNQPLGVTPNLPNDPYTPTIKEISVNYRSTEKINLTRQTSDKTNKSNYLGRIEQFFHVMPFGVAENHPFITTQTTNITLLPQYPNEGNLYIGVSALEPPQVLNLLFKVAEGSADPDLERQKVNWSYMFNNEWYDFTQLQLLSDSTNGLLTSGILTFNLPKLFNSDNTAFPPDLFWIRASVEHNSAAVCDLINVLAQAVTASFVDHDNDPDHLRQSLPAETITDFINSDAAIDKITQPYASFGGHIKEQSNEFYRRVSERLRHKHRAVTIWDYEHLVLEQFPTIYKVKCLNHTRYTTITDVNELVPGHVTLVIISNLQNKNAVDPLKPKTSLITLADISDFINTINPPCSELHVRNPIFEEIRVEFNVKFLSGFDNGFYGNLLNEEIKQFLAPWAYATKDIAFGGVIHKSMIINFVEERPYVDFVTCFNMDQIIPVGKNIPPVTRKNIEAAETSTSASILTSAPQHHITVLETEACDCVDNLVISPIPNPDQPCEECGVTPPGPQTGIGADQIGNTFIIGHSPREGVDFWIVEQDFIVQ